MGRGEAAAPPRQEGVLLRPGAPGPHPALPHTSTNLLFILRLVQNILNSKRMFTVGEVGPVAGAGGRCLAVEVMVRHLELADQ